MLKITSKITLVPCQDPWVKGYPHCDLIHNRLHARRLIAVACLFLQVRKDLVEFSGYINERPAGPFRFQLCHQGIPVYSLESADLGYAGVLSVNVPEEDFHHALNHDVFGSISKAA